MRAICLTYILVIAASCGGTSTGADASASGPNQVQGLVNGKAFNAKEALSSHFLHTNGFSFSGDVELSRSQTTQMPVRPPGATPLRPAA